MKNLKLVSQVLDGAEYREECKNLDVELAKADGIVVAFGASDDLLELRGAIKDEVGAWEGTELMVLKGREGSISLLTKEEFDEKGIDYVLDFNPNLKVTWCPKDGDGEIVSSWEIVPNCKHETFSVMEGDDHYCTGAVFYLRDLVNI